ncbi:metalloprotease family protein [Blautia coccoides]|uniref:DUF3267 domain-containing protein n=2 Tax=Blautia producta TaxID=33035 RepID=A0A7G5MPW8_9FIRM|nr:MULTISPECIES: metalloprotease family protein [Blautia]MCR1988557.1 metalloprotease family protein [Blautia coccoides]QIB55477.1 DUF3267 domain-containing protein [Blautia producta ATCC 27340 = DSM 2950]QMW76661.1 DUF3267 domain-containing protein [Blautia producta]
MDNDKRKLTEKELKRKNDFEKLSSEMQQKGYKIKNVVINTQQARPLCILIMLPFMALAFWIYYHVNGFDLDCLSLGFVVALIVLISCLTILHELIHGITWGFFAKNHFHSIDFGIIWSSFSPYCTCSEPLKKWQYLLGTAMPTLVLGGGSAVAAVMTNQLLIFLLAEYMIASGGGDFLIVLKGMLHHTDKKKSVYCDHPYECGFVVFEK